MQTRNYIPLIQAAKDILKFQYNYLGYEKYKCSSCGSEKYQYDEGFMTEEKCSPNCPWRKLKEAIYTCEHFHLGEI